jgi:hypothetical protein
LGAADASWHQLPPVAQEPALAAAVSYRHGSGTSVAVDADPHVRSPEPVRAVRRTRLLECSNHCLLSPLRSWVDSTEDTGSRRQRVVACGRVIEP